MASTPEKKVKDKIVRVLKEEGGLLLLPRHPLALVVVASLT